MQNLISVFAMALVSLSTLTSCAQDKSKRPSPPAKETVTTTKGVTISIDYSQPSVKGRTIGKEIAPFGEVWRTGANEATVFEINKEVSISGNKLAAGKYGLYTIPGSNEWTIIFNKKSDLWGSNGYNKDNDALRIVSVPEKTATLTEKMSFTINPSGKVSLNWGNTQVNFVVE